MNHATIRSRAVRKHAPRHNSVQGNKKGCTTPQFGPGQQESMNQATIRFRARTHAPRHNSVQGNKKACTTPQFGPGQQESMYHATIRPRATRKHVPRHKFGPRHPESISTPQFARTTHTVSAVRKHALCHVATRLLQSVSPLPFPPPPPPHRLFPTSPSAKPANRTPYQVYCRMWT